MPTPRAPCGWHRPVKRRHVWLVLGGTALLWSGVVAVGAWQVLSHWHAAAPLRDLPVQLSLPAGVKAQADIGSVIRTRLDIRPRIDVPFDQIVKVSIDQTLNARSTVRTVLPVRTSVHFKGDIPVDTVVQLDVPVVSWLPRFKVTLPVVATIPVDLTIPVDVTVPLVLDMPVQGRLAGTLALPVRTRLAMNLPVRGELQGRIVNRADFTLLTSDQAFALDIRQALITLPLGSVSWGLAEGASAPPWASFLLGQ
ncbi:MAG: hypothetical protein EOP40_04040 [Rubrivivax sp.]|nr:MAG: hypothetical protein EOP40_04040 [Rubrivivax sp.]